MSAHDEHRSERGAVRDAAPQLLPSKGALVELGQADLDELSVGVMICDERGRPTRMNPAMRRYFGLKDPEPAAGSAACAFYLPDGVTRLAPEDEPWRRAARGERVRSVELIIAPPSGAARVISVDAQPLHGRLTQDACLLVVAQDVTDQRWAEAELSETARRYAIVESVKEVIFQIDASGAWSFLNRAWTELTGTDVADSVGKPWIGSIHPEDRARASELLAAHSLGGAEPCRAELRLLAKDGSFRWIELFGRRTTEPGGPIGTISGTFRDISDRKRAEAERTRLVREQAARVEAERDAGRWALLADVTTALTASLEHGEGLEQMARLLVSSFAEWCLLDLVDDDGCARRFLARARSPSDTGLLLELLDRFGLPSPLKEPPLSEPFQRQGALLVQAAEDDGWPSLEPALASKAEALFPRSLLVVPMLARGEPLGVLTLVRGAGSPAFDEDERILVQEIARRSALAVDNTRLYHRAQRAIELRDEFLSIASHELRTPLQTLALLTQALSSSAGRSDRPPRQDLIARAATSIGRETSRLTRLVQELLDVSRIHGGQLTLQLEEVDLHTTVHEILERFSDELARKQCAVDASGVTPARGRWDALRLEQVITNLITNAMKYGAGAPIRVATEESDGVARIVVEDRGIGIAKEDQKRIFQRFERAVSSRNFGGLGLGLYITHQIVHAHGGTIHVESEPNEGSTFVVELPLAPPEA